MSQHLEPVTEEMADDEDNRNYGSQSPYNQDLHQVAIEDSQVEIVDPEVQLFDGADGGEQQVLEGRLDSSD